MKDFLEELKQERYQLKEKEIEIYEKVLLICLNQIRFVNSSGRTNCSFDIPFIVAGYPLFDIAACGLYITKKLKRKSLKATFVAPKAIIISWNV